MQTWRKPGSSPARKRSSTFSSKRRISSISRKRSWSRSSESVLSARGFFSTLAIAAHYADHRMRLVDQWRQTGADLPAGWADAQIARRAERRAAAAGGRALLGPATPGHVGEELRFTVSRSGRGVGPDQLGKLLGKIDRERIRGTLRVVETAAAVARTEAPRELLAGAWQAAVDGLPPDWSDLYSELELTSSDHLQVGALLTAPLNPAKVPGRSAFRFRAARRFGYGASASMVARCCARMDEAGIPGRLTILRVLSDTHNVDTQGPVWRVEEGRVTRDPVSWLLAEPGWPVYDADGKKLGKVDEVLGDEQTDIFHGLLVDGEEILAERVAQIREGEIWLS